MRSSRQLIKVDWTRWIIQNVTWEITYIIILCLIGQISKLPGVAGEGWEPNFWSVLSEPAIGGGMRSVIYWMGGDNTFQVTL